MLRSRKYTVLTALAALSMAASNALATDYGWAANGLFGVAWNNVLNWGPPGFPSSSSDRAFFVGASFPAQVEISTGTTTTGILSVTAASAAGQYLFQGVGGNENLSVTTGISISGNTQPEFQGVDVYTPVTTISDTSELNVFSSMTYTSRINLQGSSDFYLDSGNTIRGRIDHASTGHATVYGLLDTELLEIRGGGQIALGNTGNLILNQNGTISNGVLSIDSGGTMSSNFSSILRITNTGSLLFNAGYALANATNLSVENGGDVVASSYLDLGNSTTGTLSVDGGGSTIKALGSTDWGRNATGFATVSFSSGGVGTYANLQVGGVGGHATVTLSSSGQLTTSGQLLVGTGTSTVARINVSGGTLLDAQ